MHLGTDILHERLISLGDAPIPRGGVYIFLQTESNDILFWRLYSPITTVWGVATAEHPHSVSYAAGRHLHSLLGLTKLPF